MKKPTQGFTLIELLVVLALIGIMIAIAVPSFASFISNYRATAAVNDLLQAITLTRTEALKRGRRVTLLPNLGDAARTPSVSGSWNYGWTIFVDLNNNQTLDTTDVLIFKHGDLPTSITPDVPLSSTTIFGVNYVAFDGTGYSRTTAGATLTGGIKLTDNTGSATNVRTLCLGIYGRPNIVKVASACS
jgi:type IV fimbrial biogenesis protein FimT